MNKQSKAFIAPLIVFIIICVATIGIAVGRSGHKDLDSLVKKVKYDTATPKKGTLSLDESDLYDELPEITKYPVAVEGTGDVNIEIFSSGEKAGSNYDAWLIECAEKFNREDIRTEQGASVGMTVRSMSSGLGADYIRSGKYLPDLYTPSNSLFADLAQVTGADLTEIESRLVGNTSGVLVKKNSDFKTIEDVVSAVKSGSINFGYTNPQTSATGLNLLMYVLKSADEDVSSEAAVNAFTEFNNNVPYVAYTTQQMRDSAGNGSLDVMVSEYQVYVNSKDLKKAYDFIPFGIRNDNPLYAVNYGSADDTKKEAIECVRAFLMSEEAQKLATEYGFNQKDDHKSSYETTGLEVSEALQIYKDNKDGGTPIAAIFVADCSGSMSGEPLYQLKQSLSNGMRYINSDNYIGLISYDNKITVEVPINKFDVTQKSYFQGGIDKLSAGGSTFTYEAVCVALKELKEFKKDHPEVKPIVFVLSDGYANGNLTIDKIKGAVKEEQIPVYTIGYTEEADTEELKQLSDINEAASMSADSDDVVYKIKGLFNSQL